MGIFMDEVAEEDTTRSVADTSAVPAELVVPGKYWPDGQPPIR